MQVALTVLDSKAPVLGTFGKAIDDSASLNFGLSGGDNCDTACPHHGINGGICYAARCEIRPKRRNLRVKLARHERSNPADIARRAQAEIAKRRKPIPWLRLSTNGSVPNNATREFAKELRSLLASAAERGIPVHFPVETARKARRYREIVRGLCVVRESATTESRFLSARGAVSFVAGQQTDKRLARVDACRSLAKRRTERTGRKCIVCPAVAARYLNNNKPVPSAKCGNCVACASATTDVIYPLH